MGSFLLSLILASHLLGQAKTTVTMPDDPQALLALAAKSNGLNSPDLQPWHIKASYATYNADGKETLNGVFEEWWAGPHRYKISYTQANFKQTDYGTDAGLYRQGDQNWSTTEMLARSYLLDPLPDPVAPGFKTIKLNKQLRSLGKVKLNCITLTYPLDLPTSAIPGALPLYCFATDIPALRVRTVNSTEDVIYNDLRLFQGHYVAGNVQWTLNEKPLLAVTLDSIETLQAPTSAMFVPPPDAVLIPPTKLHLDSAFMDAYQLRQAFPTYPTHDKEERITGKLVLQVTIGKDGHVTNVQSISGPPMLYEPAVDAVRQWAYRPYLVNGEPVEVETQVNVVFTLGN
jgi:TonB family protein